MKNKDKIHLTFISIINIALIIKMISISWNGNDKGIIVLLFGYPIIILLNASLWLILYFSKNQKFKIYRNTTIGLILFFLPAILLSTMY